MHASLNLFPDKLRTKAVLLLFCLTSLLSGNVFARDWYVALNGNDNTGNGTSANPYRTIQAAANVALQAGDVIKIGAGQYREIVALKANNVTFEPLGDGTVTLNGTDIVAGWTQVSTGLYSTSAMTWDLKDQGYLSLGANQLFEDKKMIELARWPDQTSDDIIAPTNSYIESNDINGTVITIRDSKFNEGNDKRWKGARIWINLSRPSSDGQGYVYTVLDVGPNTIIVDRGDKDNTTNNQDQPWSTGVGTEYYLFDPTPEGVAIAGGINNMLSAGEWWRDTSTGQANSGKLFVKTKSGSAPYNSITEPSSGTAPVIESKRRLWGFWSDSYPVKGSYTIRGLNFFACSFSTIPDPRGDAYIGRSSNVPDGATGITLDGLTFNYVSHHTTSKDYNFEFIGWGGIVFNAVNSTIQNCTIRYSAASAISLRGRNLRVTNIKI